MELCQGNLSTINMQAMVSSNQAHSIPEISITILVGIIGLEQVASTKGLASSIEASD